VYVEWLGNQLSKDGATKIATNTIDLIGFQRIRSQRLAHTANGTKRLIVERPDALFSGELTIGNPDAFVHLMARGIGRHRAFGFGMLLLRPPRQAG
jgi:CRISPR system Cascade subunit CasE